MVSVGEVLPLLGVAACGGAGALRSFLLRATEPPGEEGEGWGCTLDIAGDLGGLGGPCKGTSCSCGKSSLALGGGGAMIFLLGVVPPTEDGLLFALRVPYIWDGVLKK